MPSSKERSISEGGSINLIDDDGWHNARVLTTVAAKQLASVRLLSTDLQIARRTLGAWIHRKSSTKNSDEDNILEEVAVTAALFRDAIVQFMGCFGSGKDQIQAREVFSALNGGMKYFYWLKDIRDGFAAHRSGPGRQAVTTVTVDENGRWQNVIPLVVIYDGPGPDGYQQLIQFFDLALAHVERLVSDSAEILRKEIDTMSAEQLLALPFAKVDFARNDEMGIHRDKFQNVAERRTAVEKLNRNRGG